jgi:hypothetical protein
MVSRQSIAFTDYTPTNLDPSRRTRNSLSGVSAKQGGTVTARPCTPPANPHAPGDSEIGGERTPVRNGLTEMACRGHLGIG